MVNSIYSKAYTEVLEMLKYLPENEYNKIPNDIKVIEKGEPIFMRLDKEEEIEYIKSLMNHK